VLAARREARNRLARQLRDAAGPFEAALNQLRDARNAFIGAAKAIRDDPAVRPDLVSFNPDTVAADFVRRRLFGEQNPEFEAAVELWLAANVTHLLET